VELSNLLIAISKVQEKFPISKENGKDWLTFGKMLESTAVDIKNKARMEVNK
jgi:hypothetical protein